MGRPASSQGTAVKGPSGGRADDPPVPTQAVQTLLNRTFDGFDGLEGLLIPTGVGQAAAQRSKLQMQLHAVGELRASTRIGLNGIRSR